PEHRLHRADEHLFDVDVLAVVVTARLISADHQDRRDVEAASRHQMCRRRLVARREADHPVELRAFDRDLHVVDDEVAAGEHVAAAGAGADDEVAGRGRANLEWQPTRLAYGVLDDSGDAVEMAEADRQLRRTVHDSDLRLEHVVGREAERSPLGPPDRFARGARLEVASQRSLHTSDCNGPPDLIYCRGPDRLRAADGRTEPLERRATK